jgi:hypothetical protein
VLYAASVVTSDTEQDVILKVGSDEGVRVLLNGDELVAHNQQRASGADQDEALAHLKKGENQVLVKVLQTQGPCGFFLRFVGSNGLTVEGAKVRKIR